MDNDDTIRQPDSIYSDQLMEDERSDFDKELEEAIYLSMKDINDREDINAKFEEEIILKYSQETCKRKEIFKKFIFDLNKVSKVDKDIREILEIIEPIIDSYCSQTFDICSLEHEMHKKIFHLLTKIRTDKQAIELLKTIILSDEYSSISF